VVRDQADALSLEAFEILSPEHVDTGQHRALR
jgi:hypothetical protein